MVVKFKYFFDNKNKKYCTITNHLSKQRNALYENVLYKNHTCSYAALSVIHLFIFRIYFIPTMSMESTYKIDSTIGVTLFDYGILNPYLPFSQTPLISSKASSGHLLDFETRPKRGDVVVFRNPLSPKTQFMKRVFVIGDDEVTYSCNGLYLKRPQDDEFIFDPYKEQFTGIQYDENSTTFINYLYQQELKVDLNKPNLDTQDCQYIFTWKLKKDTFFMIGDNRDHSFDSRYFGAVPYKFLIGKVRW